VVLQEDIGCAFTINSITYTRVAGAYGWAGDFSIKMAHVTIDELSSTFTDNYEPGSLQEVVFIDSLPLSGDFGSTLTIEFNEPFWYNGTDNLLIDIYYPLGTVEAAVYNWEAGPSRCLLNMFLPSGSPSAEGELYSKLPYMVLEGEMSLAGMTFGGIKVILGGTQ